MSYTSVMLQMLVSCPQCGGGMPVNGPKAGLPCHHCGAWADLSVGLWQRVLVGPLTEALSLPEGKGRALQVRTAPDVSLLFGKMRPRCSGRCGMPLARETIDAALNASSDTSPTECPTCGAAVSVEAAPAWLQAAHPGAAYIVGPQEESSADRWFVLLDTRGAVAALPVRGAETIDFAFDAWGRFVLAWHEELSDRTVCRLGLVDRRGLLLWRNEHLRFGTRTSLWTSRRGQILMADPGAGRWMTLDPASATVRPVGSPQHGGDAPEILGHAGIALDVDDTVLVGRERPGGKSLRRIGLDGSRKVVWAGSSFADEDADAERGRGSAWDPPPRMPLFLSETMLFAIGWDGCVYIADTRTGAVACYARNGQLLETRKPPAGVVESVRDLSVDRAGTVHLLFSHTHPAGGIPLDHVARMHPGGDFELWLGGYAPGSPRLLGNDHWRIKVSPRGTALFAGTHNRLRMVGASGRVLWESPAAVLAEHRLRDELARFDVRPLAVSRDQAWETGPVDDRHPGAA